MVTEPEKVSRHTLVESSAFERSLDLRAQDDAFTLFGLAMAQNALGNAPEGREAHERALARARDTYPNHAGLAFFSR